VVVDRLRNAGAIIYGKANQTELGIHVSGLNPNARYGHCRNPYNPNYHTGGSSSGSGAAVV
jgi:aspartyl-tRNA(Asn)/glutamyl-tRNA(Gln) amidotransferase subunit A